MTPKLATRILLALACLGPPGCSGVARPREADRRGPEAVGQSADRRHADLERELSLYSD